MKKTVIVISIIAIVAVVGFTCFMIFKNGGIDNPVIIDPFQTSGESGDVEEGAASKAMVEAVKVKNKIGNIDIDNTYPVIKSFKNKDFENSINVKIAGNIADYKAEITHVVDEKTPDTKLYRYVTTYERYNWGDYLTLVVNQDYQTGGIRSNTWKDIYNINVKTERIIYLEEVFEPGAKYEEAIIKEITSDSKVEFMGGEGLKKLSPYQKFYVKDGKLIIYFDPSEVASAKYGALEYEMPFEIGSKGLFVVD